MTSQVLMKKAKEDLNSGNYKNINELINIVLNDNEDNSTNAQTNMINTKNL